MKLEALVRNWWMMAIRGALAIAFGLTVQLWPGVTLSLVVVLFGVYAVLDGAWALAAAGRASVLDAWPVALEGGVSMALGGLALLWPFVPREAIYVLAGWGILTGVLEIVAATAVPRSRAEHWLLATGGVSSMFLAGLILLLPRADLDVVVRVISVYAVVFGVVLLVAAFGFRRGGVATAPSGRRARRDRSHATRAPTRSGY